MNIKNDQDRILQIVQSFAQMKASPLLNGIIPTDAQYSALSPNLQNINLLICNTTPFQLPVTKVKRCIAKTTTLKGIVYSNRHHEQITIGITTDKNQILLGHVNTSNEFKEMLVQGGGLKKSYIENESSLNKWIGSFLDCGRLDGIPTQIQTTILVELPESQLERLNKEDIETAVKKYIAAGVLPIIRFYKEVVVLLA